MASGWNLWVGLPCIPCIGVVLFLLFFTIYSKRYSKNIRDRSKKSRSREYNYLIISIIKNVEREAFSTLHVALESGSDLHVNERQKIRHYRGRSTGE